MDQDQIQDQALEIVIPVQQVDLQARFTRVDQVARVKHLVLVLAQEAILDQETAKRKRKMDRDQILDQEAGQDQILETIRILDPITLVLCQMTETRTVEVLEVLTVTMEMLRKRITTT